MFCSMEKLPPEAQNLGFTEKTFYKYTLNKLDDVPFSDNPELLKFNQTVMQSEHADFVEDIRNFVVYPDDVWVITYPKCGTTWMQEAVWQIFNDVELEKDGDVDIYTRFPFLEHSSIFPTKSLTRLEQIKNMERPRFIKSHLPIAFLPKQLWTVKPKTVYVTRNEKDVAISFYHHYVHLLKYLGTKEEFLVLFLQGNVMYGNYWDFIEQFHIIHDEYSNIKTVKYEDLKHNLCDTIKDLCLFFERTLTDEKLQKLLQHLQFSSMKANPLVNYDPHEETTSDQKYKTPDGGFTFIRRGETGAYKDEMPSEFIKRFNQVTEERLKHINLYNNDD